ncbi:DUF3784 domain-containing protein [[Clostridium] dakarense]|uniref:DUF3784 domain-containing protein n=1 Tax=Faecalimicrobium dakarense TaxID=1301100 RepID=UPI0004BC7E42|nr:DUF3784 domain-containing protein [[Clostridium] dakarense]
MIDTLIILMVGVLGIVFGALVRKYKMVYVIRGLDIEKYDKDKLCNIVSSMLIIYGITMVAVSFVNHLLGGGDNTVTTIAMIASILGLSIGIPMRAKNYASLNNL